MDLVEKGLETATEAVKQQITIASAVIGGTIAFAGSLKEESMKPIWSQLPWALVAFAVVIAAGIVALQSIAYELKQGRNPYKAIVVRGSGIVQNLAFLWGFIALLVIVM